MSGGESLEGRLLLTLAPFVPPTNDPLYQEQWNLNNTGQTGGTPGADVNVLPAWQAGYTGKGVTVGVVDSGVYYDHPDLAANYNASLSYDYFENVPNAEPPLGPLLDPIAPGAQSGEDSHGTMVAGIIAGNGANGTGTLGEAPDATIASERIGFIDPSGDLTQGGDPVVASAFTNHNQQIDVFSNSWGYPPSGFFSGIQGPPDPLTIAAMQKDDLGLPQANPPIPAGRNGLGNIFVFAAGNGGNQYGVQNTNDEAETASRFAITVAALGDDGKAALYSAKGASVLVSAPGGHDGQGAPDENGIPSSSVLRVADSTQPSGYNYEATYTDNGTYGMNGTSAATPGVSGVVALMLQANPNLSWRDVQQILAESATKNDPTDTGNGTTDIGWFNNGYGYTSDGAIVPVNSQGNYAGSTPLPAGVTVAPFHINDKYGFGEVNAGAAVALAKNWTPLQPETSITSGLVTVSAPIPKGVATGVSKTVTFTGAMHVEHAEVVLNITHPVRGDIEVILTSPNGTRSYLQQERTNEVNGTDLTADGYIDSTGKLVPNANYTNWSTSTVQDWGESATGTWTVTVADVNYDDDPIKDIGTFDSFQLNLYGTQDYAPVAQDFSVGTAQGQATTVNVLAHTYDTDGAYTINPGSVAVISPPREGSVSVTPNGQVVYTPVPGYHGLDTFTYEVKDTNGAASRVATVTVDVGQVLLNPVANNDTTSTSIGSPVSIAILANDTDASGTLVPSTVQIVTQPQFGTVSVNPATGIATYTPGPTFTVSDSFQYTVSDTNGKTSNAATVTINLTQATPVASSFSQPPANENVTQQVNVLAHVTGSASPSGVSIITPPRFGMATVDPVTGVVNYTPDANFFGSDSFTYAVANTQGALSNAATVSLTVLSQGVPLALSHEFILPPPGTVINGIRALDDPTDSGGVTSRLVGQGQLGIVNLNSDGTFTYTPGPNFQGIDSFTYVENNGQANSNVGTVRLVTQNVHFLEELYRLVLNRTASDGELIGWNAALNAGVSRAQVASDFLFSPEYLADFVNSGYLQLLGRPADAGGQAYWVGLMRAGMSMEQFLAALAGSPEFFARSGSTYQGLISALYQDFLHRPASPADISYWVGQLSAGVSANTVALDFLTSNEYQIDFVESLNVSYFNTQIGGAAANNFLESLLPNISRLTIQIAVLSGNQFYEVG
ncbi:MAG: Ig-like domain-containing protein [Pirellulales bacterium]